MKKIKIGIITSQICSSIGFAGNKIEQNIKLTGNVSEELIKKFDKGLKANKLNFSDVNEIYFDIGPGSYTGIRIGMAFVKMLEYLLKIKIVCVSGEDILEEIFISFLNKNKIWNNYKNIPLFIIEKTYNKKYSVHYKNNKMKKNYLFEENEIKNMINSVSKNYIHGVCGNFDFELNHKNIIIKKHILTGLDLINFYNGTTNYKMEPIYLFSKRYKCQKKN